VSGYDYKIVGSGLAGSTIARQLADAGKKVLLIERRPHIGGNCFDELDEHGVRIHRYGPHIFRTADEGVKGFLSRFTDWRLYEHRVLSRTKKGLLPVPVNATTLEKWFAVSLPTELEAAEFLESLQIKFDRIDTSEQVCLSRVGRELYEGMFKGYTEKQWGRDPSRLAASVCGRIPVRTNRDDRYFFDVTFQALPAHGYTAMFEKMLDHPNIEIVSGDGLEECGHDENVVWTGQLDEAFGYEHGMLPWRSLEFELMSMLSSTLMQPAAVINEPDANVRFTRTTEYRHLTGQEHRWTTLQREYPVEPSTTAEPFYPVPSKENDELLAAYREKAAQRPSWTMVGRLATYRYLEMGQAVGQALKAARTLLDRTCP
jgi:UDP-galactopyranose mutase